MFLSLSSLSQICISVAIRVLGTCCHGPGARALPEDRRLEMVVLEGRSGWPKVLRAVEIPTPITTSTTPADGGGALKTANPIAAPSLATMACGTHFTLLGPSPSVDFLHLSQRQELYGFLLGLITINHGRWDPFRCFRIIPFRWSSSPQSKARTFWFSSGFDYCSNYSTKFIWSFTVNQYLSTIISARIAFPISQTRKLNKTKTPKSPLLPFGHSRPTGHLASSAEPTENRTNKINHKIYHYRLLQ
jgi:hypothetical protein